MCGIAGFIGKGDQADLDKMIKKINHRGPDFSNSILIQNVGLAHARLSIIDLNERANQPFFTTDKTKCIVFNGEIYNYLQLKDKLMKTNKYNFRTSSDTEVLIYAYEEYGLNFLDKIEGMFAFAIYDYTKNELLLVKDRMGKKPLYYTYQGDTLIFASELKALLTHPSVSRELNYEALNQYLTYDYIPTPKTIFKGIYKLEPASYILYSSKKSIDVKKYWQPIYEDNILDSKKAIDVLDKLLDNAVAKRLLSDVPLGVFLSGGLDSSTIAYYAQKNSSNSLHTFSISFDEKSYDESSYANHVAKFLKTNHHEEKFTSKIAQNIFENLYTNMDEPFADPSLMPTYFLSKITKSYVSVVLGGDGSDELFAGYPTFISSNYKNIFKAIPKAALALLINITNANKSKDTNISLNFKLQQYFKAKGMNENYWHTLWFSSFTDSEKDKLLTAQFKNNIMQETMSDIDQHLLSVHSASDFNKILHIYQSTYLVDDILHKVDRASMLNALEVRTPFLDNELVMFVNSLHKSHKTKGLNTKILLKQLMENKLPTEIINRSKKGFGIPLAQWINGDFKAIIEYYLSKDKIRKDGFFDAAYIEKLKENHFSSKVNNRKLLWNLLIFQVWKEKYL
jgi:asparagine synthase (glutamine-hydrolysing)